VSLGVVSSPLEGLVDVELKEPPRRERASTSAFNFAGPIRNAGGTAAAVSVLIADFVRKKLRLRHV